MRKLVRRCLRNMQRVLYRQKVKGALALQRRGEARTDGLLLEGMCNRLEVRWRARDIHPWDRDLSAYERDIVFSRQALEDTEAAIARLFDALPHVDVINVGVLAPSSETLIAEGTVHRSDLNAARPHLLSVGMRLRELGMRYCFAAADGRHSEEIAPAGELCAR